MGTDEREAILADSLARIADGDRSVSRCVNGVVTFERKQADPAPGYVTRIPRQRAAGEQERLPDG